MSETWEEPGPLPVPYSRKGFYLGAGVGNNGGWAFATQFQIGFGFSDQVVAHWSSRVAWEHRQEYVDSNLDFRLSPAGVAGFGATYYLDPEIESVFVGGTLGYSNLSDWDEGTNNFGLGICGALGYQFATHFSVDNALCWGTAERDNEELPKGAPFIWTLTVNVHTG